MQEKYGQIGVSQKNGEKQILFLHRDGERAPFHIAWPDGQERLQEWYPLAEHTVSLETERVWVKIIFAFDGWKGMPETASFFYSVDGVEYKQLGQPLELFFSLSAFVGARVGLFSYNDTYEQGGHVDFTDFQVCLQKKE
jgi:hypothetical protein